MAKDLRLYVEMVERSGTTKDVGAAVSAVWQAADASMPGSDFTELWKHVSRKG
jgi:3-hydroxyisobutyrate dehydrogenase-like beta-hydroxyacid dehydrogenase